MKLFEGFTEPPKPYVKNVKIPRPKPKPKATITISLSNYSTDGEGFVKGQEFISVDFRGNNEGSGSPCDSEEEAQVRIQKIKEQYQDKYRIEVIDERPNNKKYAYLNLWKKFIEDLCKEKGQEAEIWFDTSTPYDCAVNVRMKNHNCYYECISFRFQRGMLKAYDSSFGHGTSFVSFGMDNHQSHEDKEKTIKELMEKLFANECCKDTEPPKKRRIHKVDEDGWKLKEEYIEE